MIKGMSEYAREKVRDLVTAMQEEEKEIAKDVLGVNAMIEELRYLETHEIGYLSRRMYDAKEVWEIINRNIKGIKCIPNIK